MLIISGIRSWRAAVVAASVALVAGIATAAGLAAPGPAGSPDRADAISALRMQPDGPWTDCPDNDPQCEVGDSEDDSTEDPGSPDDPGGGGGGGPCTFDNGDGTIAVSDRDGGDIEAVLVAQSGEVEIPCTHPELGWWNPSDQCYYGDFPPIREATGGIPEPPEGKTEEDGRYYYRRCPTSAQVFNGTVYFTFNSDEEWTWVDNGDVPTVTPSQVAQDWLASATLNGVDFAFAPPETGAGLVNLPLWLGVNQTPNSWGVLNANHCLQGVCVRIEALVTTVEWNMGDGTTFTCARDQHTVWQRGTHDFLNPGDNCHHYYRSASGDQPDGRYPITATSTWTVEWVSEVSGVDGELSTTRESSTSMRIDEVQVLTR